MPAEAEGDVFRDGHGIKEGRTLKDHPEFAAHAEQGSLIHAYDVFAVNEHGAFVRLQQTNDVFEQNALTPAAATDDDD